MTKFKVYLADNYNSQKPFMIDWDYELIGDQLRSEFDVYFDKQEALAQAGSGKTRQLLKGEYVKKFMVTKRINLADDPASGGLKSVFILKKGEEKIIDERAKKNLASRFEYTVKTRSDGVKSDPNGFMKFELVEGIETTDENKEETLQVEGKDIQYFQEESEKVEEKEEAGKDVFACEVCKKEFDSEKALRAHGLSHKGKK